MLVIFKIKYIIIGEIYPTSEKDDLIFKVPLKNGNEIIINLFPNKNIIESFYKLSVSVELLDALNSKLFDKKILNLDGKIEDNKEIKSRNIPQEICDEILEVQSNITQSTRKVINLLKYCLNIFKIDDRLTGIGTIYWSLDESKWQKIDFIPTAVAYPIIQTKLNENSAQHIQECILNGFEPFLALKYLHRALDERDPSNKWIDATTAAELAIKEFLIRKEPALEKLLLEVPSPPLSKLYGSILNEYAGEKSPKLNKLAKGIEIRNKLVHRPEIINIDERKARAYVLDVEIAIYHLLYLLYPDNQNIKSFYKQLNEIKSVKMQ